MMNQADSTFVPGGLRILLIFFVTLACTVGILAATSTQAHAAADTCTWTGAGSDTNITTAGNWTGCDNGNVPQTGDSALFPDGPSNKTVTIDAGIFFNTATISGDSYTIDTNDAINNRLYLSGDLAISGDDTSFVARVSFFPTSETTLSHSGTGTTFSHYLSVQAEAATPNLVLDITSDLTISWIAQAEGTGGEDSLGTVYKTGGGTLTITGNPVTGITTAGGIDIIDGSWKCDSNYCLGNSANTVTLEEGGDSNASVLELNGTTTIPNPIYIASTTGDPGTILASQDVTLSGAIALLTDGRLEAASGATMTVNSNIAIDSGQTLLNSGAGTITHNGIISGNGGLSVDRATVTLAGANTYSGTTTLTDNGNGALLIVKDNNSLGATSSGTVVNAGTTLLFDNNALGFFSEPITVAGHGTSSSYPGALVKNSQYVGLSGGITLTGDTTWHNGGASNFGMVSAISGNYDINLTGTSDTGGFSFQPGSDNNFKNLVANGVQLSLYGTAIKVVPGNLTMNAVNGKLSRIFHNNDNTIADNSVVTLNSTETQEAVLISTNTSDTIGTLAGDGTFFIGSADSEFSLGGGGVEGTFSGKIEGYSGSQIIIVGGTWAFSGTSVDAGNGYETFYVNGGTFLPGGSNLGSSPVNISSGILGGTGTIGPVNVYGGTVAPGNSPGCLNVSGDVAFAGSFTHYKIELNGTTACSGYDVLSATGTVYLNGSTLDTISLGFDSQPGDTFTILSGAGIDGTFTDLNDGDSITVGDHIFRINYTATSVTLTDITPASSPSNLASTGDMPIGVYVGALITLCAVTSIRLKYVGTEQRQ